MLQTRPRTDWQSFGGGRRAGCRSPITPRCQGVCALDHPLNSDTPSMTLAMTDPTTARRPSALGVAMDALFVGASADGISPVDKCFSTLGGWSDPGNSDRTELRDDGPMSSHVSSVFEGAMCASCLSYGALPMKIANVRRI